MSFEKEKNKMKITYIELNGYYRFSLNNIEHFSMNLNAPVQLILGLNGCGKSSLMSELSPLPGDKNDFNKTGSKIIKLEENHKEYILKNDFGSKHVHSFICDGEELNLGGTITIQLELVKQHFSLTKEIHDLLSNKEKFTKMSSSRRKEWFLKLCDTNYDFAIRVFKELSIRLRDVVGAIRTAKKTLVVESEKLLQEDTLKALHDEANNLHECLNHLLEYRKPIENDLTVISIEQSKLDEQLKIENNIISNVLNQIRNKSFTTEQYENTIENCKKHIAQSQYTIAKLTESFNSNLKKINILEKTEGETLDKLKSEFQNLTKEIQTDTLMLKELPYLESHHLEQFNSVKLHLLEIFNTIPNNKDLKYNKNSLQNAKESLNEIKYKKQMLIEKKVSTITSIKHIESHKDKKDTNCPNCKYRFSLNYDQKQIDNLNATLLSYEETIEKELEPKIKELELFVEECNNYSLLYSQFKQLTDSCPNLIEYWKYLLNKKVLIITPESGLHELNKIESSIEIQIDNNFRNKRLKEITDLINAFTEIGSDDMHGLRNANAQLIEDINIQTDKLVNNTERLNRNQTEFNHYKKVNNSILLINELISKKDKLLKDEIETERRTVFNQLIKDLQSQLAYKEHILNTAAAQKAIVDNLSKQIDSFMKQEKSLSILVKQLSPTEGLIAKGLLGFIKNFVDQMNSLLSTLWAYPIEIKSCEMLEGAEIDLDYKFPFILDDSNHSIKDVSLGSSGIEEVINLVFVLIAIQYLKVSNYPLNCDEIGVHFDKTHRTAVTAMIRSLIEQEAFSQVFIISHYMEQYGSLRNLEVCVLNPTNVIVPEKYNQHVKMF